MNETVVPTKTRGSLRKWTTNVLFLILVGFGVFYLYQSIPKSPYPDIGQYEEWGDLSLRLTGASLQKADMVVVFLHGANGNAFGAIEVCQQIAPQRKTCFVTPNGPVQRRGEHRAWFGGETNFATSKALVVEVLEKVRKENPEATVVLGGFSQGGILSSNFLQVDSELVDALFLLSPSGWLEKELTEGESRKVPVFFSHGKSDKALAYERSKNLSEQLVELGYDIDWLSYDEGHTITREVKNRVKAFLDGLPTRE